MLRVSIHAGPLLDASPFNLLAWCDIGYAQLEPIATYKTLLYQRGEGSSTPALIEKYPRWSASLWDLAMRALALGLHPNRDSPEECVLPALTRDKGCAFANKLSILIEHRTVEGNQGNTLGTAEISQVGRKRGQYQAWFDEHAGKRVNVAPFGYKPDYFRAAELLLQACAYRFTGQAELPPRPGLVLPKSIEKTGLRFVLLHTLAEPARTGFLLWLHRHSEPPIEHLGAAMGIAPETMYVKFLQEAI